MRTKVSEASLARLPDAAAVRSRPSSEGISPPRLLALAGTQKIQPHHLQRQGIVYIRQSTPGQVRDHLESQRRQYGLHGLLQQLGWSSGRIEVIDEDQGHSGSTGAGRPGFQRLLAEIALGRVGLVIGLETSRLSRDKEEWQHFLKLCAVTDTLVADGQNLYSLRDAQDRLHLDFKGSLNEYEISLLKERMIAGMENKAKRGELVRAVPVGFRITEDGKTEMDPDEAVRSALKEIFARFRRLGSARKVAISLREEGALLPRRRDYLGRKGVRWEPVRYPKVRAILTNPAYAGAYAYGRLTSTLVASPDGSVVRRYRDRRRRPEEWPVLIQEHHPGYISWAEFEEIQQRIWANVRDREHPGPIGRGLSVLASLVRCGVCGHRMGIGYTGARHRAARLTCVKEGSDGRNLHCQAFGGRTLEDRVTTHLLYVLEPATFEAALVAQADVERERAQQLRNWDLEVEKAEQAEARARQQYIEVEPGNRLVARELERQWEAAIEAQDEARRKRELRVSSLPLPLTEAEKQELRRVVNRMGLLWRSGALTPEERKEIARLLISHIEAKADRSAYRLDFAIHWTTGKVTHDHVRMLRVGGKAREIRDSDLEIIRKMAGAYTDVEIARLLGHMHRKPSDGERWTERRVERIRQAHGWAKQRGRKPGGVSLSEAGRRTGIDEALLRYRLRRRSLRGSHPYPSSTWRIPESEIRRLQQEGRRRDSSRQQTLDRSKDTPKEGQ